MSTKRASLPHLVEVASANQRTALDPQKSLWVGANAGTGKTEVLTRRMLATLLADFSLLPSSILALTFTEAAAAEMAARLPKKLEDWLGKETPEATLAAVKTDLGLEEIPQGTYERLRELRGILAEKPPLITTIHGFAQQLLQRFPAEAGVPGGFTVLDEPAKNRLLTNAIETALTHASQAEEEAVGTLLSAFGERGWQTLTGQVITHWPKLARALEDPHGGGVTTRLQRALNLQTASETEAKTALLPTPEETAFLLGWQSFLENQQTKDDTNLAAKIGQLLANPTEENWGNACLDSKGALRTKPTVRTKRELPGFTLNLQTLWNRVESAIAEVSGQRGYTFTMALIVWGNAIQRAYTQAKQARAALDFQDLLDKAEILLKQEETEWVWFRLDRHITHLMVDEAQDNNPQQAALVEGLARSLLSGLDAENRTRTVMVVGDMKQSIYRFQGAVPQTFTALAPTLHNLAEHGGGFAALTLSHSFRTGPGILGLVNHLFENSPHTASLLGSANLVWPTHASVYQSATNIHLWPLDTPPITPKEKEETPNPETWPLPTSKPGKETGLTGTITRMGAEILRLTQTPVILNSTGAPAQFEDMMVLVQRNGIARKVAQGLQNMGIPATCGGAAGTPPQVVEDVLALLQALANPFNTLALSQVLHSGMLAGLGMFPPETILNLAKQNPTGPWLPHLPESTQSTWAAYQNILRNQGPAALIAHLIHTENLAAKGAAAGGATGPVAGTLQAETTAWLMALHTAALASPSLIHFLAQIEEGGLPNPATQGAGGVKILTMHKSKGLEAPVVFLPDTTRLMNETKPGTKDWLLWQEDEEGTLTPLFWQSGGTHSFQQKLEKTEKEARTSDSLRGLYVALTRPKERLYIGGFLGKKSLPSLSWYALVQKALEGEKGAETPAPTGWQKTESGTWLWQEEEIIGTTPTVMHSTPILPSWQNTPVPPETLQAPRTPPTEAQQQGLETHAALEKTDTTNPEAAAVMAQFPEFFGPNSRAEVPIWLGDRVGRIDRLILDEPTQTIIILDFKTGTPQSPIPETYITQLQTYAQALANQYPTYTIKTALIWTISTECIWLT